MRDHPSLFHLTLPKPGKHNMVCFEARPKKPAARGNPIPSGMKAPATKLPIGMIRLEKR
jgi:hypothetical protein